MRDYFTVRVPPVHDLVSLITYVSASLLVTVRVMSPKWRNPPMSTDV